MTPTTIALVPCAFAVVPFAKSLIEMPLTDPLSAAPLRIDQSQHNEGPTNKVRHACAYAWRARQIVQKGIGEAHVLAHKFTSSEKFPLS